MGSHSAANLDYVTAWLLGVEYKRGSVTDRGIEATGAWESRQVQVGRLAVGTDLTVKFAARDGWDGASLRQQSEITEMEIHLDACFV